MSVNRAMCIDIALAQSACEGRMWASLLAQRLADRAREAHDLGRAAGSVHVDVDSFIIIVNVEAIYFSNVNIAQNLFVAGVMIE